MSDDKADAVDILILTGGQGRRLKEITKDTPKPLVDINGQPFLSILIKYLAGFGCKKIVLCSGYDADYIKQFAAKFKHADIELIVSLEETPLGTAGGVKHAQDFISTQDFIVINGDTFLELDYNNFIEFYFKKRSIALLGMTKLTDRRAYGSIEIGSNNRIVSYQEKVALSKKDSYVSAGVYMFNKIILDVIPLEGPASLEYDVLPKILNLYKNRVHGYYAPGDFVDIGTPKNYYRAIELLQKYR